MSRYLAILALAAQLLSADGIRATIADRAAAHDVSPAQMIAVATCESSLDPSALGHEGERGLYQLHPAGLLLEFYARGYSDPWSAWQSADFAAAMWSEGRARAWSCWWTEIAGRDPPWWGQ